MDMSQLAQKRLLMHQRVRALFQSAHGATRPNELLSAAFEELQTAMEELQAAEEKLRQQQDELMQAVDAANLERQRYEDLFDGAPIGYLVTSIDGTIQQANQTASRLLNSTARLLVGRPLAMFLPEGQRRAFRTRLTQLQQASQVQEWEERIQSWDGTTFDAELTVASVRNTSGRVTSFRWLIRDITKRRRTATPERQVAESRDQFSTGSEPPTPQVEHEPDPHMQRRFTILAEASVLLAVAQDAETTLTSVARLAVPELADLCIIDLADSPTTTRRLMAYPEPSTGVIVRALQIPATTHTANTAQPVLGSRRPILRSVTASELIGAASDADQNLNGLLRENSPQSALLIPLFVGERELGSMTFVSTDAARRYGPEDIALADELGRRAAVAIARTRHHREV